MRSGESLAAEDRALEIQQAEDERLGIWTPFEETDRIIQRGTGQSRRLDKLGFDRLFFNNRYHVLTRKVSVPGLGDMTWLSIRRNDRLPVRDWRELQRIKNEVVGTEAEAVELFPADSRLVDSANQYHLWCGPPGMRFPFGFQERLVLDVGGMDTEETHGARQRKL